MAAHVCDGIDKVTPAIEAGNWGVLLRGTLRSMGGARCSCALPILHGRDLMCACCLLENTDQIAAYERLMNSPHPFEEQQDNESAAYKLGMCDLCSGWRDDPRHQPEGG